MNTNVKKEVQEIIDKEYPNLTLETFIDRVNWYWISKYQKLSEDFIREFREKINVGVQEKKHKEKSYEQKLEEIQEYARINKLEFDGEFLYAYRDHDQWGRGQFNKTIFYEQGKYYIDWHFDLDSEEQNSFGLGIFPEGNTKVKVNVNDWGVSVKENSKARVWGLTVL